jgi:hypothetical protein
MNLSCIASYLRLIKLKSHKNQIKQPSEKRYCGIVNDSLNHNTIWMDDKDAVEG